VSTRDIREETMERYLKRTESTRAHLMDTPHRLRRHQRSNVQTLAFLPSTLGRCFMTSVIVTGSSLGLAPVLDSRHLQPVGRSGLSRSLGRFEWWSLGLEHSPDGRGAEVQAGSGEHLSDLHLAEGRA